MSYRTAFTTLGTAVLCLAAMPALSFDSARWTEVEGGDWRPDQKVLKQIDATLPPALQQAAASRGLLRPWLEYEFQYQGRTSLNGGRYVEIDAFCNRGAVDDKFLRSKWLKVFDGDPVTFLENLIQRRTTLSTFTSTGSLRRPKE